MASRQDAEAESRAEWCSAACAVVVGTVGDATGGARLALSACRGGVLPRERQRKILDAGAVRPTAGCERVGLGLAQKSIEVVESQDQELVSLEPSQVGAERGNRVLGTSHGGEPTRAGEVKVSADPGSPYAKKTRVAELAAQGSTNREIAQTLFVTSTTVEVHLTSDAVVAARSTA